MSLFDLQTCESRTWLDVLAEELLIQALNAKGELCNESTQMFSSLGLSISPCDYFNDETYELIQARNFNAITNILLVGAGLPPWTPQIIKKGYESLDNTQKKEVDDWGTKVSLVAATTVQQQIAETLQNSIQKPNPETIQKSINRLNAISKVLNNVNSRTEKVASAVEKTALTINTIDGAITVIDGLVITTDIALATSATTPTGIAATFARAVQKLERYADRFRGDIRGPSNKYGEKGLVDIVCRVSKIVLFVQVTLGALQAFINVFVQLLEALTEEQINSNEITPIQLNNTILQAAQGFVLDNSNNTYRGYRIEIKTDPESPPIAPRRYAVAIDRYGVVVLEGRPSFSSSTEILVNEIKYQIDRLNR